MGNRCHVNGSGLSFFSIEQTKVGHKTLSSQTGRTAAVRGLVYIMCQHFHTNNKPRRQTNPLTTRCDTTRTGSPSLPLQGQAGNMKLAC